MSLLGLPEAQWNRVKESHMGKFKALTLERLYLSGMMATQMEPFPFPYPLIPLSRSRGYIHLGQNYISTVSFNILGGVGGYSDKGSGGSRLA